MIPAALKVCIYSKPHTSRPWLYGMSLTNCLLIAGDILFEAKSILNQSLFNCLNLTNTKYFYETDHHVLIIWSCDIGEGAIVDEVTGSLFTQVLCDVLAKLQSGTQPKCINITEIVSDTSEAVETAIRSERQQGRDCDYQSPQCEQINMDNMDIILKRGL